MMRQRIAALVETALQTAATLEELVTAPYPAVIIGIPANPEHGDFSCNIAMQIAIALAILLGIGCILPFPIYWWLFVTPFIRLLKRTRKPLLRRIP